MDDIAVEGRLAEGALSAADLDEHVVEVEVRPGPFVERAAVFAGRTRCPDRPDRVEVDWRQGECA